MKGLDSNSEKKGTKNKDMDPAELVSMMGMAMLDSGGLDTIQAALQESQDPGQVVGQFIAQMMAQMAEFTRDSMGIDPAVYGASGGFIEQILDYIERKLQLPSEFSDQVYGEVLEIVKAGAAAESNQQQAGPPAPQPQGGRGLDTGVA